ncbi:dynactin ro-3/DYNACTIN [Blumeria hordei DH14]|uniref:Dynactin ro-3/DYNACTIN n=1 Tax=Blumeria graminis f. sp. hordei (strain DH14) TaxID=546991 RepID=N1JQC7_BLUG1|nr:dynactin ro-3/DYNACTIN [Blumeria hordei DH14]
MGEFSIGQSVRLNENGIEGTVRFVGETAFAPGMWVGVELESMDGKNDGSVQNQRYFECKMGRGMFLRPTGLRPISQPLAARPTSTTKKVTRPRSSISVNLGRRKSSVQEPISGKRISSSTSSPISGPSTRPGSRPSSIIRSPTKSPMKQHSVAASGTASNTSSAAQAKSKTSGNRIRTSMPPPPPPKIRQSTSRISSGVVRERSNVSPKKTAPVPSTRISKRIGSITSQGSENEILDDTTNFSDSPKSASSNQCDISVSSTRAGQTPTPMRQNLSPVLQGKMVTGTPASRSIEDLKTKIRIMEKKALENREKIKLMEKTQEERDRFELIIQKMQIKYQPQQQEVTELRKQLKEANLKLEEAENNQVERDLSLEMATLDREMAEETAEVLKSELDALKLKTEELELEVEVLREENEELGNEISPEDKASQSWLHMERNNDRLKEALLRLRDMTEQKESELRSEIKSLLEDLKGFTTIKEKYQSIKKKLSLTETVVEDLKQQLDTAIGAEDMIEELTEKNMGMKEELDELRATITDFETLKEISDEVETNHVEIEKEMQAEIDLKESIITEQKRQNAEQNQKILDLEYNLSRFRELVINLKTDFDDMKASHAITETETEQLSNRSREIWDLNMKLQVSATKTQLKTIDMELRRLDAQQASEHLSIVQLFLPNAFTADRDAILALLRFKRVGFKANLLHGFIKERINSKAPAELEEDCFVALEVLDKLSWVTATCHRFVNAISHCNVSEFTKYESSLYDLEPVERALNSWIELVPREELKVNQCAEELQRTIALLSHLAEVRIKGGLESYADEIYMKCVVMRNNLENIATAILLTKNMVQAIVPSQVDENELAQDFSSKTDAIISQTRNAKVIIGKTVKALEDLNLRSLSLMPNTLQSFKNCEDSVKEMIVYAKKIGANLFMSLHEEGQTDLYTYQEVQNIIHRANLNIFDTNDAEIFSTFSTKVLSLTNSLIDLVNISSDLSSTQEFERAPEPWVLRSQELKKSKIVPVNIEGEMSRLKDETRERAKLIALKDQSLDEASVKIEILESRMRDAALKNKKITELEHRIEQAKAHEYEVIESIEQLKSEIKVIEADRDNWKRAAEDFKVLSMEVNGIEAGQEQAVATAREVEILTKEISTLQAAVRYLREEARQARLVRYQNIDWLEKSLSAPISQEDKRKNLVLSEGQSVLTELLSMSNNAQICKLGADDQNKLAWRPASSTPQYHVAKQKENYETWCSWRNEVLQRANLLKRRDVLSGVKHRQKKPRMLAAQVSIALPAWQDKVVGTQEIMIQDSQSFEGFKDSLGFV